MKRKVCLVFILFCLSVFAVSSIIVRGASQVVLTPTSGVPGDSVSVQGTSFAANNVVGIGLGQEITIYDEAHDIEDTSGNGPFTAFVNHYPIKPGSFSFHCDVSGVTSDYCDDYANGTLATTSTYAVDPFVNYVTGEFGRSTNNPWDDYIVVFTANYTYYQFNLTSAAGVPTNSAGAFTVNITVPAIWNGTEPVTVMDRVGNKAISEFTIYGSPVIPEHLTIVAILLLSSAASVVSFYWLRKKPINEMAKYG